MFIAALFTTAKTWNQLNCQSTNEWIMKFWKWKMSIFKNGMLPSSKEKLRNVQEARCGGTSAPGNSMPSSGLHKHQHSYSPIHRHN